MRAIIHFKDLKIEKIHCLYYKYNDRYIEFYNMVDDVVPEYIIPADNVKYIKIEKQKSKNKVGRPRKK